jgi:hypothetical protein
LSLIRASAVVKCQSGVSGIAIVDQAAGWLDVRPGGPLREDVEGFRRGLAEIGFSQGRDVTVEYHIADGRLERLSALAADLVRRGPAAIIVPQEIPASVARAATRDIPIIFLAGNDPVELGLVASLNRPGSNLTGVAMLGFERIRLAARIFDPVYGCGQHCLKSRTYRCVMSAFAGERVRPLNHVSPHEFFYCDWQIAYSFAGRVKHGVGDCGSHGYGGQLAKTLRAQRARFFIEPAVE